MQILDGVTYYATRFYIILRDFRSYSRQRRGMKLVQNEDIQQG